MARANEKSPEAWALRLGFKAMRSIGFIHAGNAGLQQIRIQQRLLHPVDIICDGIAGNFVLVGNAVHAAVFVAVDQGKGSAYP